MNVVNHCRDCSDFLDKTVRVHRNRVYNKWNLEVNNFNFSKRLNFSEKTIYNTIFFFNSKKELAGNFELKLLILYCLISLFARPFYYKLD